MIKPILVEDTLIELIETNTANSEEPTLEFKLGSTSCSVSIKDIKKLKQLLTDGETFLSKKKEQIALEKNMKLF